MDINYGAFNILFLQLPPRDVKNFSVTSDGKQMLKENCVARLLFTNKDSYTSTLQYLILLMLHTSFSCLRFSSEQLQEVLVLFCVRQLHF